MFAQRRLLWLAILGFAIIAVVIYSYGLPPRKTTKQPGADARSQEEQLVREFISFKNKRDPKATELLDPAPPSATEPISEEYLDRYYAESLLRGDYRILAVHADPAESRAEAPRFLLAMEGSISSDVQVKTAKGTERRNRVLTNPDVVVEVRDGKIIGVRAQLHRDPDARPPTRQEQERIRRLFGGS